MTSPNAASLLFYEFMMPFDVLIEVERIRFGRVLEALESSRVVRFHCSQIGHPLVGDVTYDAPTVDWANRMFLHSYQAPGLEF